MSDASDEPTEQPRLARPYTLVGGRTQAAGPALPIEALVWRLQDAPNPTEPVHRRLVEACDARGQSIAELAALLDVPIGVSRVLVGDLIAHGVLEVGKTSPSAATSVPVEDLQLLRRVLANVERL